MPIIIGYLGEYANYFQNRQNIEDWGFLFGFPSVTNIILDFHLVIIVLRVIEA